MSSQSSTEASVFRTIMQEDEGYVEGSQHTDAARRLQHIHALTAAAHRSLVERNGVEGLVDRRIADSDIPLDIAGLSSAQRADLAYLLMLSLPTPSLSVLQARVSPLMHFDLLGLLPPELCRCVLANLELRDVLNASMVCKAWRARVWDDQLLWRVLFRRTGWLVDEAAVEWWNHHMPAAALTQRRDSDEGMAIDDVPQPLLVPPRDEETDTSGRFSPGLPPSPRHLGHPAMRSSPKPEDDTSIEEQPKLWMPKARKLSSSMTLDQPPRQRKRHATQTAAIQRTGYGFQAVAGIYGPSKAMPLGFDPSQVTRTHYDAEGRPWVNWRHLYITRVLLDHNWRHGIFEMYELHDPSIRYSSRGPPPPFRAPVNTAYPDGVYTLQFDNDRLVVGLRPGHATRYDLKTGRAVRKYNFHTGSVLCLQYDTPETRQNGMPERLVTGSSDGHAVIWELESGRLLHDLHGHTQSVLCVRFSGDILVTCSKDRTILLWRMSTGNQIRSLTGHRSAVNAIGFKNGLITSASGDRDVRIWSAETGECLRTFSGHLGGIASLSFDGQYIATGSSDSSVRITHFETGNVEVEIGTPVEQAARDNAAAAARFPPNSPLLHFAAGQGAGLPPLFGRAHNELVRAIAFDSRYIVTGSYDETIRVWDRQSGLMLLDIHAHSTRVFNCEPLAAGPQPQRFSVLTVQFDMSRLISCSQAGIDEVRVFDFAPGQDMSFLKA